MESTVDTKKRKADDATNGDEAAHDDQNAIKRPKPNAGVDLSVLEKAKKALAMQKELKAKLDRIKQAKASAAAAAPPSDQSPLAAPPSEVPPSQAQQPEPESQNQLEQHDSRFFDPFIGTRSLHKMQRRSRPAISFIEKGVLQKEAEIARLKAQYGEEYVKELEERKKKEEETVADGRNPNLIPVGTRGLSLTELAERDQQLQPIPNVEWWDAKILVDKTKYDLPDNDDSGMIAHIRLDRITHYIEHPVLLDPPLATVVPPPQPLKLTKKELKKLRTQRRQAREQEKQELIRQGLLEPPQPKVKISNLMRVLGAEATIDPTAIEAEVRRQMAERAAAHEDRNLARMLTPAERKEKKLKKLLDASKKDEDGNIIEETLVSVYKIMDLSSKQLRFKIEVNAKENHMSGITVIVPGLFSVVVVEGGVKTLRRYEKLMLKRIQWNAPLHNNDDGDNDEQDDNGDETGRKKNSCHLVWSGMVKSPSFRGRFRTEEVMTEISGRRIFEERGVGHYWDIASSFTVDE